MAELNEQQARALQPIIGRHLRFYGKLCKRLDRLGIDPRREMYRQIQNTYNCVHALSVKLHYAVCKSGVAR